MKIYLAAPIRSAPDGNRPLFERAQEYLCDRGHVVFNPSHIPKGTAIRTALKQDLDWILDFADVILILAPYNADHFRGRPASLGVQAEVAVAEAAGIPVRRAQWTKTGRMVGF